MTVFSRYLLTSVVVALLASPAFARPIVNKPERPARPAQPAHPIKIQHERWRDKSHARSIIKERVIDRKTPHGAVHIVKREERSHAKRDVRHLVKR